MTAFDEPFHRWLRDLRVGISVSPPTGGELARRGLSRMHLDHVFVELARQLLAAGASVVYGGDLRKGGFTTKLSALVRTYALSGEPATTRMRQYFAWPTYEVQRHSEIGSRVTWRIVPVAPQLADLPDPLTFNASHSVAEHVINAECLTALRKRMTEDVHARVLLGGRTEGHLGRYPGIVEEASFAARAEKPVFVLGGFGGCASCVAGVLRGENPTQLSKVYQEDHTDGYEHVVKALGDINYRARIDELRLHRSGGIFNGLRKDDNALLLETLDLEEAIALVIRGLRQLRASRGGGRFA